MHTACRLRLPSSDDIMQLIAVYSVRIQPTPPAYVSQTSPLLLRSQRRTGSDPFHRHWWPCHHPLSWGLTIVGMDKVSLSVKRPNAQVTCQYLPTDDIKLPVSQPFDASSSSMVFGGSSSHVCADFCCLLVLDTCA